MFVAAGQSTILTLMRMLLLSFPGLLCLCCGQGFILIGASLRVYFAVERIAWRFNLFSCQYYLFVILHFRKLTIFPLALAFSMLLLFAKDVVRPSATSVSDQTNAAPWLEWRLLRYLFQNKQLITV